METTGGIISQNIEHGSKLKLIRGVYRQTQKCAVTICLAKINSDGDSNISLLFWMGSLHLKLRQLSTGIHFKHFL